MKAQRLWVAQHDTVHGGGAFVQTKLLKQTL